MRVVLALLSLIVPLQPFAAAALCFAVDHGRPFACGSGMSDMSRGEAMEEAPVARAGAPHTAVAVWSAPGKTSGCSAVGLCDTPALGVAPVVIGFLPERPTDMAPQLSIPPLGPGTRPAPPPHPPRA